MKKPLGRVIEPAVTIVLVVLAFTFIPWLSSAQAAKGSIADRIRSGAQALKQDMKGEVDQVVDVEKLGRRPRRRSRNSATRPRTSTSRSSMRRRRRSSRNSATRPRISTSRSSAQAQEKLKELGSSSSGGPAKPGSTGRSRAAVEALEKRTQEELDKAKAPDESPATSPEPIPDEPNPIDQTNLRDRVMSTSTTEDLPPAAEVIELEPTMTHGAGPSLWADSASGSYQPRPAVAMGEGSLASLAGETDTLRRRRLLAAAVSLAATFGLLLVWVFASDNPGTLTVEGSRYSLRVGLIGLRCLLAAAVAGLLASEAPLTRKQLRAVEYVLFLGLTLLLMASQYFVGLDLMHRGPEYVPIILAFIKDGVIQMLVLMMIYGTLIPNPPAVAARVLVAMFVGPVAVVFLLRLHPDVGPDRRAARRGRGGRLEHPVPGDRRGAGDLRLVPRQRPAHRAARGPQVRPVPARAEAGRRRDGRGLPRRAPAAEAPLRPQADQARGRVPTRSPWPGSSARCSRPPGCRTPTRSRSTTTATPTTARSTT